MDTTDTQEVKPKGPFRILDLPIELFEKVLVNLDHYELFLIMRVNKYFKSFVDNTHRLQLALFLCQSNKPKQEWQEDLSINAHSRLRYVSLTHLNPAERAWFEKRNRTLYKGSDSDYSENHPIKTPFRVNPCLDYLSPDHGIFFHIYFSQEHLPTSYPLTVHSSFFRMQVCQPACDLEYVPQSPLCHRALITPQANKYQRIVLYYVGCSKNPEDGPNANPYCDTELDGLCYQCPSIEGPEIEIAGGGNLTVRTLQRAMAGVANDDGEFPGDKMVHWYNCQIRVPKGEVLDDGIEKVVEKNTEGVKKAYWTSLWS